jgi:RNA polymerase sigma-70 factor (ECF subfamily)
MSSPRASSRRGAPRSDMDDPRSGAIDMVAFERLTMPYLASVVRFARSLTHDAVRAEDLVQETYLQAMRGWHTFRVDRDPRRWLFAICHNTFLRTARREDRYVQAPNDDPELESIATALAHSRAQQSGVAEAAERIDLAPAINRALAALSPAYRVVVMLVDVDGERYEDAAEVLGIPVGTVRSRLFRGRRMLQDMLFEYASDAGFTSAREVGERVGRG